MVFDRPDWLAVAAEAAEAVWRQHWLDGRLRRASRDGRSGTRAGHRWRTTPRWPRLPSGWPRRPADAAWLDRARALVAVVMEQFDDGAAGFFDTAADAETLYTRPQDPTDNATPSGLSAAVHALALLAELTGEAEYADRAERAAASAGALAAQAPRFAGWLLADAISRTPARTPVQVPIVGPADDRPGPSWCGRPTGRPRPVRWSGRGAGPAGVRAAGRPAAARRPADGVRVPGVRLPAAGDLGRRSCSISSELSCIEREARAAAMISRRSEMAM